MQVRCQSALERIGRLGRLKHELLNGIFVLVLGLETHAPLFALEALELDLLVNVVATGQGLTVLGSLSARVFLANGIVHADLHSQAVLHHVDELV